MSRKNKKDLEKDEYFLRFEIIETAQKNDKKKIKKS